MLRTNIIASSISNLTDARYFAAWGVEAMGFDLSEISPAQLHAFKDWISGPLVIGQFNSAQGAEAIENAAQSLELDMIQLDFLAPEEWTFSKPTLRTLMIEQSSPQNGSFILKSENPNFNVEQNYELISTFCAKGKCYLDFNIDNDQYEALLENVNPTGFILRGGDEEKVGFKSYDDLDEIMELLEA